MSDGHGLGVGQAVDGGQQVAGEAAQRGQPDHLVALLVHAQHHALLVAAQAARVEQAEGAVAGVFEADLAVERQAVDALLDAVRHHDVPLGRGAQVAGPLEERVHGGVVRDGLQDLALQVDEVQAAEVQAADHEGGLPDRRHPPVLVLGLRQARGLKLVRHLDDVELPVLPGHRHFRVGQLAHAQRRAQREAADGAG